MARNEEDYALVVGIDRYPALRSLEAAERDALEFVRWLKDEEGGGLPVENIKLIVSSQFNSEVEVPLHRTQPDQADIDFALTEMGVGMRSRVGRRLYFFFAGHGLGPSFDDVAMVMANASQQLLNHSIGLRDYRSYLIDAAPFDEVVFLLDCCREFSNKVIPRGPGLTQNQNQARAFSVQDFLVLAAEYGRKAFEETEGTSEGKQGILSTAVREGLIEGKAADAEGRITAASLRKYLLGRVPELATAAQLRQVPRIPSAPEEMVLATVRAPDVPLTTLTITAADGLSGDLILRRGDRTIVEQRPISQTPWTIELPPNLYKIEHTESDQSHFVDATDSGGGTHERHFG